MRKLPIQAFLALSFATTLATAQELKTDVSPYYLQLGLGGVSTVEVDPTAGATADFDTGLGFSLLAGRDLGQLGPFGVALEGELYYSFMNIDKGDLNQFTGAGGVVRARGARQFSLMGNLILDYPIYDDTSVYFGGGIGFAPTVDFDTFDTGNLSQEDDSGVVAQLKLGIKYDLGERSDFLIGYRYFKSEALDINSTLNGISSVNFEQHALEFSVRWGI